MRNTKRRLQGAAGLALLTSLAAVFLANTAQAELIVNGGFENPLTPNQTLSGSWPPATAGTWGVDRGIVRTSINSLGVSPHSGDQMIELDATGGSATDFYQLIDVRGFGGRTAVASAWFNSAGGAQNFSISLRTFTTSLPLNASSAFNTVFLPDPPGTYLGFTTDSDPGTWEQVTGLYYIDPAATYVAFGLHALNSGARAFADDASFDHVPEPATLAIMGVGVAGLGFARRRRKTRNR